MGDRAESKELIADSKSQLRVAGCEFRITAFTISFYLFCRTGLLVP